MNRGYIILAENTEKTNYVKCAEALALSIRRVMPNSNITLLTTSLTINPVFDMVISLPHGDQAPDSDWKLINDWQVYDASPYDETIKLEADMFIPRTLEHWWDILGKQDVVVSSTIRNYKGEIATNRFYRHFIDDNKLPEVYNAITYFRKSPVAKQFFEIVRDVFENWDQYKAILKCNPQEEATTDWAYALACHIIGPNKTMMPSFTEMSMVHMKQHINGLPGEDWTKTLIYECMPEALRIHTFTQKHPFHYQIKSFADVILQEYPHG